jgi:outer membrane protein
VRTPAAALLACALLMAQAPPPAPQRLTLPDAEAIAVKNHPQVSAALLQAMAANQVTLETRAAYFPTLYGSATSAGALDNSRIAAGNLNNPVIYNRVAAGLTISQVITDFGRTSNLVASARYRTEAQQQNAQATREQVLLQVNRAYFGALRSQKVLTVAQQTVAARQLISDQVTALANSKLKSGLDVSFANVNLSEAKLLLVSAQNEVEATFADLSAALGYPRPQAFQLADVPGTPDTSRDFDALLQEALRDRPEVASLRAEQNAALRFARAERALSFPTVSALSGVGVIPGHEDTLRGRYGALGFNINIPVFNGGLFSARRAEADLRAQAAEQNIRDLENRIARDVHVAWLNANTAYQRLGLTAELLQQASLALDLAQTRYDLGLSSIVELSQAQLNKTSAEIASASAQYDYQLQRAVLDYQIGALR